MPGLIGKARPQQRANMFREPVRSWVIVGLAIAVVTAIWFVLVPLALSAASVLMAGVFIATVKRPALGLAVLVVSVPLQDSLSINVGSFETTWTRSLLLFVVAAWAANMAFERRAAWRMPALALPFVLVMLTLVLSVGNARDVSSWAAETYRWGVALVAYVLAVTSIRNNADRWLVIGSFAMGVVGSAAVAVYQAVEGVGPASFTQRGVTRAYAAFGEPNPFAGYLEMAVLPLLAIALSGAGRSGQRWNASARFLLLWVPICAGVVALLLSQSRGGMLGFAAGAAVVVWWAWPRFGRYLVILAAMVGLLAVSLPTGTGVREAVGIDRMLAEEPVVVTPDNFAVNERMAHWGAALEMWRSHPWIGVGAGQYNDRFREFTPSWRFRIPRGHAHSAYLQAAAQAGALGLAAYVTLLVGASWSAVRRLRGARTDMQCASAVGVLAVTTAVAVHGVFEYLHVLSLGIVLSAVWALAEVPDSEDTPVIHGHH